LPLVDFLGVLERSNPGLEGSWTYLPGNRTSAACRMDLASVAHLGAFRRVCSQLTF